ncbi:MAG TPA: hypothetical protein PK858_08750, partial [Saprospiraceae bacterium]|nr:hypothetical protein [Saprospiraceae bacterium]
MQSHIAYFFLRLWVEMFRLLPFRAVHALSGAMSFVLYRLIGYRKKVVLDNLRRAFPERPEAEIRRIAEAAYLNLADMAVKDGDLEFS